MSGQSILSYLQVTFSSSTLSDFATLPPTTQREILNILDSADAGPVTNFTGQSDSFYLSLADQFLTVAPLWLVHAVEGYQWTENKGYELGDNNKKIWYPIGLFAIALSEREAAYIPISNEPPQPVTIYGADGTSVTVTPETSAVLTGGGRIQIIADTSQASQALVTPLTPVAQSQYVVTPPAYIPGTPTVLTAGQTMDTSVQAEPTVQTYPDMETQPQVVYGPSTGLDLTSLMPILLIGAIIFFAMKAR